MQVEPAKIKVKCDASGCKNKCDYVIVNKKFVFDGNVYLCEDCINSLYGEIGRYIKPKNLKPLFKRGGLDEK